MKHLTRRSFLKSAAVTTAAVSWSAKSWSQIPSANDDVRFATVGFGGRGGDHIGGLSKVKGCRIAGLCDVDDAILSREKKKWDDKGVTVETSKDIRKLLESKNIDAISIATPNHWHALAAIWAVQAGKDVYVEKPVSHNVWEGRKIVEAARKYQKIVQTGTQSRSSHAPRLFCIATQKSFLLCLTKLVIFNSFIFSVLFISNYIYENTTDKKLLL